MVMKETRALYIIVEGETDAAILHTLLDCKNFENVYQVPAGGYSNISSVAKTIRLLESPVVSNDKIIIAFDADSLREQVKNDKVSMMRQLTSAEFDKRIGVFCFLPTIDQYLFHDDYKIVEGDIESLKEYLKDRLPELKDMPVIKEIQSFIDE
jgi:5S rRNA maturation endonuclease (ribonuclease M5)